MRDKHSSITCSGLRMIKRTNESSSLPHATIDCSKRSLSSARSSAWHMCALQTKRRRRIKRWWFAYGWCLLFEILSSRVRWKERAIWTASACQQDQDQRSNQARTITQASLTNWLAAECQESVKLPLHAFVSLVFRGELPRFWRKEKFKNKEHTSCIATKPLKIVCVSFLSVVCLAQLTDTLLDTKCKYLNNRDWDDHYFN